MAYKYFSFNKTGAIGLTTVLAFQVLGRVKLVLCSADNVHHVADQSLPSKDATSPSITKFCHVWDTSNIYMRPRIFCLEHAVQVEEILQSKGGAKMLVICHSGEIGFRSVCTTILFKINRSGSTFRLHSFSYQEPLEKEEKKKKRI